MKIQQFLAPDAVSLSLACSSRPAAAPARGFSSRHVPVIMRVCHLHRQRWNCTLGAAAGCQRAGRRARPARLGSLLTLAGVCCRGEVLPSRTVLALCFPTTTWFRAAELFLQPGGAYVFPPSLRLFVSLERNKRHISRASWGALMQSQPFLHPPQGRGAGQTSRRGGRQRTWRRVE